MPSGLHGLLLWAISFELHYASSSCRFFYPIDACSNALTMPLLRTHARPIDCIGKIAKAEGFMGFYKGWSAHYMRLGPHTVFTFMFLEQAKKFATELGY